MRYRFKPLQELYWSVVTAASIVLLTGLVTLDPEAVVDWRAWAIALGGGVVRAAAGAAIDWIRRGMTDEPPPRMSAPLAIMHRQCGGVAFLSLVQPVPGAFMLSGESMHANGRPTTTGESLACDSCRAPIAVPTLRDGYWIAETSAIPGPPPVPNVSFSEDR